MEGDERKTEREEERRRKRGDGRKFCQERCETDKKSISSLRGVMARHGTTVQYTCEGPKSAARVDVRQCRR